MILDDAGLREQCQHALARSDIPGLGEPNRGRVRDAYSLDENLLLVATDRVTHGEHIIGSVPFKGEVLTRIAGWWFDQARDVVPQVVKTVVDKFLTELQAQLDDKRVTLEVEDEAREWLAREGYDEKMGARPMQRLIQEKIKRQLAEDLLFGDLSKSGGTVHITIQDGDLAVEVLDEDAVEV